jgi:superfamily II DNA/RNA helicase
LLEAPAGSGKTVACVIVAIVRHLSLRGADGDDDAAKPSIGILVLSPSRELAQSIEELFKVCGGVDGSASSHASL